MSVDPKESETLIKERKRFVEYEAPINFEALPIVQVLSYFNSI